MDPIPLPGGSYPLAPDSQTARRRTDPEMERRSFIGVIAGGLLAAPFAAEAQQAGKVYRAALVFTTSPVSEMAGSEPVHPSARAFVHELRDLGYREGQNLILERRSAEGKFERFPDILAELVGLKADAIVTVGEEMTVAAKKVTTTVPIVMLVYGGDPVESGLVSTLARPGGNITGLVITASPEIEGKRVELLKTALPKIRRVAFLGMRRDWDEPFGKSIQSAARLLGVTLLHAMHTPNEYADAFAMIIREHPDAVLVANTPTNFANRRLIVDFMMKSRLPGMYSRREYVEAGGLISYGTHVPDLFRRAATFVDKILKGAKPTDLPIEQPTRFELVINFKTAKALGLTIPPSLLLRADEVIQ
jgi:putative ABC transport system substrate-binding protein